MSLAIVETLECPKCGGEIDVLMIGGELKVVGGCVNCDHQPTPEDTEIMIHHQLCTGCSACEWEG